MAGGKRKYGQESPTGAGSNKSRSKASVEPRVDPTYGQRSAIPGLDHEHYLEGDEDEHNDEVDALAYLKSVRLEATGIPNLLIAPKSPPSSGNLDLYEKGVGDFRGRYQDGAFFAAQEPNDERPYPEPDPQIQYFESILSRVRHLREQIRKTPPAKFISQLNSDHPIQIVRMNYAQVKWWRWKMRTVDPLPAQIASMDKHTVLSLLKILPGGKLLQRGKEIEASVSRWTWSLLARLPERGELSSEEIGIVRELGKAAVLVGLGLREEHKWDDGMMQLGRGYEGSDEDGFDDDGKVTMDGDAVALESEGLEPQEDPLFNRDPTPRPDDLDALKAQVLESLASPQPETITDKDTEKDLSKSPRPIQEPTNASARWNTKATVDMIITIAGELYGQRDLLEFRGCWGETN